MPTPRRWPDEATRKREYRKRKRAEAKAEAAKEAATEGPEAEAEGHAPIEDAPPSKALAPVFAADPSRTVLEAIRDDADALDSDRIRAAQTLTRMDELAAINQPQTSDLVELRRTIEALPPGDRLPWLRGELEEHRAAGAFKHELEEE